MEGVQKGRVEGKGYSTKKEGEEGASMGSLFFFCMMGKGNVSCTTAIVQTVSSALSVLFVLFVFVCMFVCL